MKTPAILPCVLIILLTSCNKTPDKIIQPAYTANDGSDESLNAAIVASPGLTKKMLTLPESTDLLHIPQDPRNSLTTEKVQLGQLLFHETRLAGNPKTAAGIFTYSCATCHHAEAGFQSGLAQALGEGGLGFGTKGEGRIPSPQSLDTVDLQDIRTPTTLNVAYQEVMLWNGSLGATGVNVGTESLWSNPKFSTNLLGFQGVETQAIAALTAHRMKVDTAWFSADSTYKSLFDLAFSDLAENERISPTTVGMAIAAYERTLLTNQTPFQQWLRGNKTAMSADEKLGGQLFFGKAGCVSCHSGPALNSMNFYSLGMADLTNGIGGAINIVGGGASPKGRGGFTGVDSDMYKFKVPQLYNLKDVNFFGHGCSFTTVSDVVHYLNNGISQNANVPTTSLAPQFVPLALTDKEMAQLTKFLEVSLYDANLTRYEPASVPSGNCIPNNDPQSKIDRGCQ